MSYQRIKNDGTTAEKAGRKPKIKEDKTVQVTIYVSGDHRKTKAIKGDMKKAKLLIYKFLNSLR